VDDDAEQPGLPTVTEQASGRLRAANLIPPVNSTVTFDEVGVVVSGRDGITAADSVLITETLGSIPHQVVE
jgi:hypothetical protein